MSPKSHVAVRGNRPECHLALLNTACPLNSLCSNARPQHHNMPMPEARRAMLLPNKVAARSTADDAAHLECSTMVALNLVIW